MPASVDAVLQRQIGENLVRLERKTVWEDAVRSAWALVGGYTLFVLVCTLIATRAGPSKGGKCSTNTPPPSPPVPSTAEIHL